MYPENKAKTLATAAVTAVLLIANAQTAVAAEGYGYPSAGNYEAPATQPSDGGEFELQEEAPARPAPRADAAPTADDPQDPDSPENSAMTARVDSWSNPSHLGDFFQARLIVTGGGQARNNVWANIQGYGVIFESLDQITIAKPCAITSATQITCHANHWDQYEFIDMTVSGRVTTNPDDLWLSAEHPGVGAGLVMWVGADHATTQMTDAYSQIQTSDGPQEPNAPLVVVTPSERPVGAPRTITARNVPDGVTSVNFTITRDGESVDFTASAVIDHQATTFFTPSEPGTYAVDAWGIDADGDPVSLGRATFTVTAQPTPTPPRPPFGGGGSGHRPQPTKPGHNRPQPTKPGHTQRPSATPTANRPGTKHPVTGVDATWLALAGASLTVAGSTLVVHRKRRS